MNSRTKKFKEASKEFHKENQKCLICFQPAQWCHLLGRNNPAPNYDSVEHTVPLCWKHHQEYDRNTSAEARINFWEKHNYFSLAKVVYDLKLGND